MLELYGPLGNQQRSACAWNDTVERLAQPVQGQPQIGQGIGLGMLRPEHASQSLAAVRAPRAYSLRRARFQRQVCEQRSHLIGRKYRTRRRPDRHIEGAQAADRDRWWPA